MDLEKLKQDIRNGELAHIIFESNVINDLNIRFANDKEKNGFFSDICSSIYSIIRKNFSFFSCKVCEIRCASSCTDSSTKE